MLKMYMNIGNNNQTFANVVAPKPQSQVKPINAALIGSMIARIRNTAPGCGSCGRKAM
jgi:hypothetical protein